MIERCLILYPGENSRVIYWCLGCKSAHNFNPRLHKFNDDLYHPTVSPSLLISSNIPGEPNVCHSYINNGHIQYLSDCQHEYAGKTVELPDVRQSLIDNNQTFYFDDI